MKTATAPDLSDEDDMLEQERANLEEQLRRVSERIANSKRKVKDEGVGSLPKPSKKRAIAPTKTPAPSPAVESLKRQDATLFPGSSGDLDQPKPKPSSRARESKEPPVSRPVAAPSRVGGRVALARSTSARSITPTVREPSPLPSQDDNSDGEDSRDARGCKKPTTEVTDSGKFGVVRDPRNGKAA